MMGIHRYDERALMVWDKIGILKTLKKLHKQGVDLSYNAMASRQQSLVSASAYHFRSYRKGGREGGNQV